MFFNCIAAEFKLATACLSLEIRNHQPGSKIPGLGQRRRSEFSLPSTEIAWRWLPAWDLRSHLTALAGNVDDESVIFVGVSGRRPGASTGIYGGDPDADFADA